MLWHGIRTDPGDVIWIHLNAKMHACLVVRATVNQIYVQDVDTSDQGGSWYVFYPELRYPTHLMRRLYA